MTNWGNWAPRAALCVVAALPLSLYAHNDGADPRLTGAPGESTCLSCHSGTALNGGGGSLRLSAASTTYTPGVKQRIQVQISDSAQRRWGFEATARLDSARTTRAGDIASVDSNTRVMTNAGLQFITHTLAGTRNGTTGGVTFEFDWTPPATDVGPVIFYAAGNAANGNNADSGDRIYTTTLTLSPAAAAAKPAISSDRGVVSGASFQAGIAPRSWVTIIGTNLSTASRAWASSDFVNGALPSSLEGVSVTINGKSAYVQYVSPTQINVVAPADIGTGPVEVKVTSNGQTSDAAIASVQTFAPAFFAFDGKYLAATHADNTLLGKQGLFPSAPNATTPARPGEVIVLYGTGFGATDPVITPGQFTDRVAPIAGRVNITIGGIAATVSFAGLVPPFAELYQFNVQVPSTVPAGDQPVVAEIGGVSSLSGASCCFITVQQ